MYHVNIIAKNERYILFKPGNTWDMNFKLYDKEDDITFLIDIEDVSLQGIHLSNDLSNIDEIKEIAWKTI